MKKKTHKKLTTFKESMGDGVAMHGGALPGAFTADILGGTQTTTSNKKTPDTKKQNRRRAPKGMNIQKWLNWRVSAEEEEDEYDLPGGDDYDFLDDPEFWDDDNVYGKIDRDCPQFDPDVDPMAPDYDPDGEFPTSFDPDEFIRRHFPDTEEEEEDYFDDDDDFDDEDFEDDEYDEYDFEFGDEDEDFDELDFDDDERSEHDLDREFSDDPDEFDDEDFEDDDLDDLAHSMIDSISDEVVDDIDGATGTISKWWRERVVSRSEPEGHEDREFEDDEFEEEQERTVGGPPQQTQATTPSIGQAGPPKIDRARMLFQQLIQRPDITRSDIIAAFVQNVDVTQSTAVSYYERLAKEAGMTNQDEQRGMAGAGGGFDDDSPAQNEPVEQLPADTEFELDQQIEPSDDPNRQGIIRTVDNAHLVFKRQSEDGTFEELWVYNIGDSLDTGLKIRRDILAGTDISQNRTRSEDESQSYDLTTLGNAQILHIKGLSN